MSDEDSTDHPEGGGSSINNWFMVKHFGPPGACSLPIPCSMRHRPALSAASSSTAEGREGRARVKPGRRTCEQRLDNRVTTGHFTFDSPL